MDNHSINYRNHESAYHQNLVEVPRPRERKKMIKIQKKQFFCNFFNQKIAVFSIKKIEKIANILKIADKIFL